MAVYTQLGKQDICSLLTHYNLGELESYRGVEGGVENTNYFLDIRTADALERYVLTLFEHQAESTLPFVIGFTHELQINGLSVPTTITDKKGEAIQHIKNKPAVIVPFLTGQHPEKITVEHCQQIGEALGKIHQTGLRSFLKRSNDRGIDWLSAQAKRLSSLLPAHEAIYMQKQWKSITSELKVFPSLPEGLIHGDLFHDNALFVGQQLTSIIDFYQSCYDYLLYDIAVTVNDWCIESDLTLNYTKTTQLLAHYAAIRPFSETEKKAWPLMLRLAAFRFWVSRIITFIHPEKPVTDSKQDTPKRKFLDPDKFKHMVEIRTKSTEAWLP